MGAFGNQQICNNAQIGISIEPEANVHMLPNSDVSVLDISLRHFNGLTNTFIFYMIKLKIFSFILKLKLFEQF